MEENNAFVTFRRKMHLEQWISHVWLFLRSSPIDTWGIASIYFLLSVFWNIAERYCNEYATTFSSLKLMRSSNTLIKEKMLGQKYLRENVTLLNYWVSSGLNFRFSQIPRMALNSFFIPLKTTKTERTTQKTNAFLPPP